MHRSAASNPAKAVAAASEKSITPGTTTGEVQSSSRYTLPARAGSLVWISASRSATVQATQ